MARQRCQCPWAHGGATRGGQGVDDGADQKVGAKAGAALAELAIAAHALVMHLSGNRNHRSAAKLEAVSCVSLV